MRTKGIVLSLDAARVSLRFPTCVATILAQMAGGEVLSTHPGRVIVALPNCTIVAEIRVRVVNVHDEDARVRAELGRAVDTHNSGT